MLLFSDGIYMLSLNKIEIIDARIDEFERTGFAGMLKESTIIINGHFAIGLCRC